MKSAGQRKVPNSKRNLDMALQRLYGAGANLVQVRMAMANTIVGQMLPDVVSVCPSKGWFRRGRELFAGADGTAARHSQGADVLRGIVLHLHEIE
jgi:hypothetical protein